MHFCREVKRCFAVAAECCGKKRTPYLPSKNPSFGNLQLESRNFIFPGRSLKRLFPAFVSDPETNLFPGLGNVCFSAGNKPFFQSFFVSPAAPQASQAPGFETNLFHLKTKLLNLSSKLAEPHPYSDHDCLLLTMISGNPTCSSVKTWAGYGKG